MRRFDQKHPGIRIDRIPVRGRAGLIFALGVLAIFLVSFPEFRVFGVGALVMGAVTAAGLYWWHNQTRW